MTEANWVHVVLLVNIIVLYALFLWHLNRDHHL